MQLPSASCHRYFMVPSSFGDLLPGHHRRGDATGLVDLGPEGLGDVRHLFGGGHTPAEPLEELLAPERGLALVFAPGGELFRGHGLEIDPFRHLAPSFRSLARKKPSVCKRWGQRVHWPAATSPSGPGSRKRSN